MESGTAPIILVDHATLNKWVKSGLATIHDIGDIKFNDETETKAAAVSKQGS